MSFSKQRSSRYFLRVSFFGKHPTAEPRNAFLHFVVLEIRVSGSQYKNITLATDVAVGNLLSLVFDSGVWCPRKCQ